MFTGEHVQKMDDKGRVIVPFKFRDELGNKVVITRGLDGCLFAFSEEVFQKLEEKLAELPFTDTKVRDFNRFFLAGVANLETDKLGRVLMPSVLRGYASLQKEVVWVGVGNRMEIWDIDEWNKQMADFTAEGSDANKKLEELAEYMAELGI